MNQFDDVSTLKPFQVHIPDQALADLRARLTNSRRVEDRDHTDWVPGPPPSFVWQLSEHWLNDFDWRAVERRINRQPQVLMDHDGLAVHAIHRRSSRDDAVPLLLIHGWPGAFLEYLDLCDPLAEPGTGQPAFHPVVPSLPGYGFSTTRHGINPQRIAAMLAELMTELGYHRFMIQGGNWGSLIGTEMARRWPERVVGLHLSSISGSPPPAADNFPVADHERPWITEPASVPHFTLLSQKPASAAYALNDSPAGLAAWLGEKLHDWADNREGQAISGQQMLEIIALYWFTGTIGSSMRLYHEFVGQPPAESFVGTPTAVALFPRGLAKMPRSWAQRLYNIRRWTLMERGGHFPTLEVPELLLTDIRGFARQLEAR